MSADYHDLNLLNIVELDNVLLSNCSYLDINDYTDETDDNSVIIGHLNIHSIPNKHEDLIDLLDRMKDKCMLPDILLLCETFLNEKNFDKYIFPNYELVNEYRKKKSRGGVSIMINCQMKYSLRDDLKIFEEGKFESLFIEVSSQKGNIIIGEIYRVPGTNELDFLTNYELIVNKIRNENKKIIIGTDQNLDYLKMNTHHNTMRFFEMNLSNNIIPTIYKPTRVTHNTATLIDNIYVDADLISNVTSYVLYTDISDHFMCVTKICLNLTRNNTFTYSTRKLSVTALRNIRGALNNINWNFLEQHNVNDASELLNNEIVKALDFYAPKKTIVVNKSYKRRDPWFTSGLRTSAIKCWKLYKKVLNLPPDNLMHIEYKKYRNLYKKLRRKAKFKYYNDLILTHRNDSKKLWKILNVITGKLQNKKDISDEIILNGIRENNMEVISNGFGKFYSEIGRNMAEEIKKGGNIQDPMLNTDLKRVHQSCFFFPTSKKEIEYFIKKLKSKNSKGHDEVTNNLLKSIYPSIINALYILFNKSLGGGEFPRNMKLAIVKPLYKGKSKLEISNYRPISLLPVISKILEKIVNCRLVKFFKKYNVLYEGQYGFRKNRSTLDAILDLTGNIVDGFDKGMYTIALFLDMSKAFDSIKHETLFKKMELYGIRGMALN